MASTLVINPGSSSRKYALYVDGRVALEMHVERTANGFETCSKVSGIEQVCQAVTEDDFTDSTTRVAEAVNAYLARAASGMELDAVALRVVAPGSYFQEHRLIDDDFVDKLAAREASAPLHIPATLRELKRARKLFPNSRLVAASDSAFHKHMPPQAREYSLPSDIVEEFDIRRFGYHGLSVGSIVRRAHMIIGMEPERMIVCHIGNGTSVTAVKQGAGVETSMGFAPSTGVPMGTRGGDIDNAALLELMKVQKLRAQDAELLINTAAGLQGLAGDSDIRILLDRRTKGDQVAIRTLETFAYHIQKTIAAQTVALGGLDALVLTATASLRSADLRALVLGGLSHLGVRVGENRNQSLVGKEGVLSARNSAVKTVVMRTDEMGEMAAVASQVLCAANNA